MIQLAVAPVFLPAGIPSPLGVRSTRLGRMIDTARVIERRAPQAKREEQQPLRAETTVLSTRIRSIDRAIRLWMAGTLEDESARELRA
jgi:hypothetical protein